MADYVTLMGAEQVQSAGNTMRSAAEEMKRASDSIQYSMEMNQRFMREWLDEFRQIMEAKHG